MFLTILTPTYNRATLLARLYESIKSQHYKDFEWLIVDDGSTDATKTVVENFVNEKAIRIRYLYKRNGGKHTALNLGVKNASGDFILIADSDDLLLPNSVSMLFEKSKLLEYHSDLAGIVGVNCTVDGSRIGSGLPQEVIECSPIEIRYLHRVTGDLSEVYKTSVLKEFPFPEYPDEKFCPEVLVWNRIGKKYKLLYFNEVVYIRDYQDGGLTAKITKIRMKSPIASTTCYAEMLSLDIPLKDKLKAAVNYWRFRLCCKKGKPAPNIGWMWMCVCPLGWLMHVKDLRLVK
ncbi:glycosyltransferase family A protein [Hoylesella shahii]|jgi:glycosyl transferase cpsO|uniref:glycosyltransferase family A protein n=1 Tax=Hoylesella shahii TaxID=228603 RepID=UPI0028D12BD2|nr:glycosyltransferase family A protein [Hoylesella shahii]